MKANDFGANPERAEILQLRGLRQAMLEMLSDDLDKLDDDYQLHPAERLLAERLAPKLAFFIERQNTPDSIPPEDKVQWPKKKK